MEDLRMKERLDNFMQVPSRDSKREREDFMYLNNCNKQAIFAEFRKARKEINQELELQKYLMSYDEVEAYHQLDIDPKSEWHLIIENAMATINVGISNKLEALLVINSVISQCKISSKINLNEIFSKVICIDSIYAIKSCIDTNYIPMCCEALKLLDNYFCFCHPNPDMQQKLVQTKIIDDICNILNLKITEDNLKLFKNCLSTIANICTLSTYLNKCIRNRGIIKNISKVYQQKDNCDLNIIYHETLRLFRFLFKEPSCNNEDDVQKNILLN